MANFQPFRELSFLDSSLRAGSVGNNPMETAAMIRKVLFRLFLAGLAVVGVVATALGAAVYFALQQPDYYTALRAVEMQPADQSAAELYWKQTEADFERWMQTSVAKQAATRSGTASPLESLAPLAMPYDPVTDTYQVRLTERQLNAQLAASKATRSGDWRNPRVRITDGRIDLAFEIATDEVLCVPSVALQPTITTDGQLQLDIVGAYIGQLPLPLKTIFARLPQEFTRSTSREMELNLTAATPCITVNMQGTGRESPKVKSLSCHEGELVVEFLPPVMGGESL